MNFVAADTYPEFIDQIIKSESLDRISWQKKLRQMDLVFLWQSCIADRMRYYSASSAIGSYIKKGINYYLAKDFEDYEMLLAEDQVFELVGYDKHSDAYIMFKMICEG